MLAAATAAAAAATAFISEFSQQIWLPTEAAFMTSTDRIDRDRRRRAATRFPRE